MSIQTLAVNFNNGSSLLINLKEGQNKDYVQKNISKILTEIDEDPNLITQWEVLDEVTIKEHDPYPLKGAFLSEEKGDLNKPNIETPPKKTHKQRKQEYIGSFMEYRDDIFKDLDYRFLRCLEEQGFEEKETLIREKNFYRDLPFFIEKWGFWKMDLEKAFRFNPYGNVLIMEITDKGSGYIEEPNLLFSSPLEEDGGGSKPIIQTRIDNGELVDIIIVDPGHGYSIPPNITVTEPESENGIRAKVTSKISFYFEHSYVEQEE